MIEVVPGARPADLVPGEPDEVEQLAARLGRLASSAGAAGARLDGLEDGGWSGAAAAEFRRALGEVPARLTGVAAAFGTAAQALTAYGRVLRESQSVAAQAVRIVEQSTPETLTADRQAAERLLARARTEVEEAGRLAARRLSQVAAEAPGAAAGISAEAAAGCGVSLAVTTEHELTDPDEFVVPPGDWGASAADVRFTAPHEVGFAGAADSGAGAAGWQSWAGGDPARDLGGIEPAALTALGVAAVGLAVIGRRRREGTALDLVGLDEAELRRRREEFGGARHRDGVLAPARTVRLQDADAWRTRLASASHSTGTVQRGTDPGAGGARSVDRDVRGAVLRTGRPAHEGA